MSISIRFAVGFAFLGFLSTNLNWAEEKSVPTQTANEAHAHAVDHEHEAHHRDVDSMQQAVDARLREVATSLLAQLPDDLREQAQFKFDDDERRNWHFIPKEREGVLLKEMDKMQRRSVHDMLRTVLSTEGYLQATTIMGLESVLRELEKDREGTLERRDPEKYWLAIFGDPSKKQPWGWRFEGHHLSLNFTSVGGVTASFTPFFLGANPAEVPVGPKTGLRVLGAEEDLARQLVKSLNQQQRAQAIIAEVAPREVITVPDHAIDVGKPAGLPAAEMSEEHRRMLSRLINLYVGKLQAPLAANALFDVYGHEEDFGKIHFAWAGSLERGQGHYYRIHAPRFIIEYDNTQNDANHVHAVWHSVSNNFGLDALKKHYEEHQHEE